MSVNWTRDAAAHLLRRAGFGGTPAEIDACTRRGHEGAVSYLVDYERSHLRLRGQPGGRDYHRQRARAPAVVPGPDGVLAPPPRREDDLLLEPPLDLGDRQGQGRDAAPQPEQDRARVRPGPIRRPRRQISQDPAMLVWLDNATNRVGRPNENYARELMELFSLGIGHYSEQDVREAARALTGWTVANYNRDTDYNAATFVDRPAVSRRWVEDDPRPDRQFRRLRRDRHHPEPRRLGRLGLGAIPRREALGLLRRNLCAAAVVDALQSVYASADTRSARSCARSSCTPSSTRPTRARPGCAALSSTPSPRSACSRGRATSRRLPTRCRDGPGPLQPRRCQGLGLGRVLVEHRLALRAGLAGQYALDQPRREERASTRRRCSRARTPRPPRGSSTRWPRASTSTTSPPTSAPPGSTT